MNEYICILVYKCNVFHFLPCNGPDAIRSTANAPSCFTMQSFVPIFAGCKHTKNKLVDSSFESTGLKRNCLNALFKQRLFFSPLKPRFRLYDLHCWTCVSRTAVDTVTSGQASSEQFTFFVLYSFYWAIVWCNIVLFYVLY